MSVKKMYYNETELHDKSIGFYPKIKLNSEDKSVNMKEIYITFSLFQHKNKYYWRQINGHVMYGITKKNGLKMILALSIFIAFISYLFGVQGNVAISEALILYLFLRLKHQ
jgi:hypothetical protein